MPRSPAETRKYASSLRKGQMERTADLIVAAAAEEIAANGMVDLSMPKVAERAGVAVRTLYRHFATREDLLLAIGNRLEREMTGSGPALPSTAEQFVEAMPALFAFFEDNADAVEAMHATNVGRQIRLAGRMKRTERSREVVGPMYEGMPEQDIKLAFAMLRAMFGSSTWLTFRKEMGLDADEAKAAIRWMSRMYVREMKRHKRQLARERKEGGDDQED